MTGITETFRWSYMNSYQIASKVDLKFVILDDYRGRSSANLHNLSTNLQTDYAKINWGQV